MVNQIAIESLSRAVEARRVSEEAVSKVVFPC